MFFRQVLCPALIQLLVSPQIDTKSSRAIRTNYSIPTLEDGKGNANGTRISNPHLAQTICAIAGELVRLVGNLKLLRPTLETLFRQILLCSQTQHRIEALKVVKEVGSHLLRRIFVATLASFIDYVPK